jgi:inward rectifier potassium channel
MKKKEAIKVIKKNSPDGQHRDVYHNLLKISWLKLFFVYIFVFVSINCFFAALYLAVPGCISGSANNFSSAFFFSVQTFSTVGYGTISPVSLYGNTIVVLEIMTGVVSMAVTTGLLFAKFSRPSAKILYSKNMLITNFDGKKVLMFRMANARSNNIISANVEFYYLYNETTPDGLNIVRFLPLNLQKNYSPTFSLSWSVFHTIDSESPFWNKSTEEIQNLKFEFVVLLKGTDGTYSQNIHDMHHYQIGDILFQHHFVDILERLEDGTRVIDYKKFHLTYPNDTHNG